MPRHSLIPLLLAVGAVGAPAACSDAPAADPSPPDAATRDAADAPPFDGADALSPDGAGASTDATPPPGLDRWLVGDPADFAVAPRPRGLVLMGGGRDVDGAFAWASARAGGGDVVVLRASGSDGYNDYLLDDIGGFDSVETLRVDTRAHADSAWVAERVLGAELIFIAGGDQSVYDAAWRDTALSAALAAAWDDGVLLGGTSAGLAILGDFVYTGANGSVISAEALADPYDPWVTLAPALVALPPLAGVVTDSHFADRDRMGRLIAFLARLVADGEAASPLGLGLDERAALVVDADGVGAVLGSGSVYVIALDGAPDRCVPGEPLALTGARVTRLRTGDTVTLPAGLSTAQATTVDAAAGALSPAAPY